jgi:hypothetical protein
MTSNAFVSLPLVLFLILSGSQINIWIMLEKMTMTSSMYPSVSFRICLAARHFLCVKRVDRLKLMLFSTSMIRNNPIVGETAIPQEVSVGR